MPGRAIVHLVRHAQGYHNLGEEFFNIRDPRLTPLGKEQCSELRQKSFADQSHISAVFASPLVRTLNTAALVFEPALRRLQDPIIAVPGAQEITIYACDQGSDPEDLAAIVKGEGWSVDLSLVHPGWHDKSHGSRYGPESSAIRIRARETRQLLKAKAAELLATTTGDVHIALVAHGGMMHFLTNDWEDAALGCGTGWYNCETRSYEFQSLDVTSNDEAWLVERDESRIRRGKTAGRPSREQQEELYWKAMRDWEDQGLPSHRDDADVQVQAKL